MGFSVTFRELGLETRCYLFFRLGPARLVPAHHVDFAAPARQVSARAHEQGRGGAGRKSVKYIGVTTGTKILKKLDRRSPTPARTPTSTQRVANSV